MLLSIYATLNAKSSALIISDRIVSLYLIMPEHDYRRIAAKKMIITEGRGIDIFSAGLAANDAMI
jgi:hypothetical protein